MERISQWPQFLSLLGPFLASGRPLEAMERAGILLAGDVAAAFIHGKPAQTFPPDLVTELEAIYGPAPSMRVFVGRDRPPDLPPTPPTSGYNLVASVQLSVLNDVLYELWRVGTIPHELSAELTQQVFTLPRLLQTCTGVPPDAVLGNLQVIGPPRAVASTAPLTVRFDIPWLLPVASAIPTAFQGKVSFEVLLDFVVEGEHDALVHLSLEAVRVGAVSATLAIIPFAGNIVPRSTDALTTLDGWATTAVQQALFYLSFVSKTLAFHASLPIAKSRFPNSTLKVVQAGATTVRSSGNDYAVVGINVQNLHIPIYPGQLAGATLPGPTLNLHTVVAQEFASDALAAVITSGDLAAFFNRVLARHSVVKLAQVRVDGGQISFDDGYLSMSLDMVAVDACEFGKDLSFTASLTGTPSIANGTLTIVNSDVNFDLDNWDVLICTILGGILGPIGILVTIAGLAVIASINPTVPALDIPVAETSNPLPGSDKVVQIELTQASMTPGLLTADGSVTLVSDPLHVFAYLRVVFTMGPLITTPIPGATVDLFELDNPAPAFDDVNIPQTGSSETITAKYDITEEITYTPQADEYLGSQTTDEDGRVTFVVVSNNIGGTETRIKEKTEVQTGHVVSSSTEHFTVPEALPDLGVTVTASTGEVLARRRLVALNVPNRRLGTFDHPVEVKVTRPTNVDPTS